MILTWFQELICSLGFWPCFALFMAVEEPVWLIVWTGTLFIAAALSTYIVFRR
jgi:hypothetical protein